MQTELYSNARNHEDGSRAPGAMDGSGQEAQEKFQIKAQILSTGEDEALQVATYKATSVPSSI